MSVERDRITKILDSFCELIKKEMANDRINYYCKDSKISKKVVIRELSHTGNGYISCGHLQKYKNIVDDRGFISIKNMSEEKLRRITKEVIESMIR